MKYVLYIDYRVTAGNGCEYIKMNAKNILEAIEEADEVYNNETMYLIRIMEKSGKIEKINSHETRQLFTALECKRSYEGGWHRNDTKHGENSNHKVNFIKFADGSFKTEYFEIA